MPLAYEGWTPYCRHIEALHIWRLWTILHVHCWYNVPQVEIHSWAGTKCLETMLLRRQLGWLGHVISCLETDFPAVCSTVSFLTADARWGKSRLAGFLTPDLRDSPGTEVNGVWQEQSVCGDPNSATHHIHHGGRDPSVQYVAMCAPQPEGWGATGADIKEYAEKRHHRSTDNYERERETVREQNNYFRALVKKKNLFAAKKSNGFYW